MSLTTVGQLFVNFWVIFGYFGQDWKRDQNRKKNERRNKDRSSTMAGASFLLGCYADVSENKIIVAGNKRTPADITVLKILRYGTARVDSRVQFVWRLQLYGLRVNHY